MLFRSEQTASGAAPTSWMLDLFRRTRALRALTLPFAATNRVFSNLHVSLPQGLRISLKPRASSRVVDALWLALIAVSTCYAGWRAYQFMSATLRLSDVFIAIGDGFITLARVVVLIALASLIWVPSGGWIGLRPKLA